MFVLIPKRDDEKRDKSRMKQCCIIMILSVY